MQIRETEYTASFANAQEFKALLLSSNVYIINPYNEVKTTIFDLFSIESTVLSMICFGTWINSLVSPHHCKDASVRLSVWQMLYVITFFDIDIRFFFQGHLGIGMSK